MHSASAIPGTRRPPPLAVRHSRALDEPCQGGFVLFLLVNVVLFVRPSEIISALDWIPIYEILMVVTIVLSAPVLIEQLRWRSLKTRPITICVVGLLPAILLSDLVHGYRQQALASGTEFLKIVLYYLLLTGLVRSAERFHVFVKVLSGSIVGTAVISLLQYYGVFHVESMAAMAQWVAIDESGEVVKTIMRMRGSGIFGDPNDLALILVTGILIAIHFIIQKRSRAVIWLAVVLICGVSLALTSSRGGLLSMAAGASSLLINRFGWKRSIPGIILALGAMVVFFGGRQTNIDLDNPNDTAQGRIHFWRDGMELMHRSPVFGTGCETFGEQIGAVAHNSYVQCYVELGIVGGTLFVGALYLAVRGLRRINREHRGAVRGELRPWAATVMAIVIAYFVGAFALTRTYVLPTYLVLGLAAVYCQIVGRDLHAPVIEVNWRLCRTIALVGVLFLVGLDMFVRITFR